MPESSDEKSRPTRRALISGVGAVGVAATLAACGTASDSGSGDAGQSPAAQGATGTATSAPAKGGAGNPGLAKTSDITVGGGKVFADQKVVVTQPTSGSFKCFTAICTHQGCTVDKVTDGTIQCPCHGSMFSITDGSVKAGPAPQPLAAKAVTVKGGEIYLA